MNTLNRNILLLSFTVFYHHLKEPVKRMVECLRTIAVVHSVKKGGGLDIDKRCSGKEVTRFIVGENLVFPSLLRGFPGGSDGNESACNVGDLVSIPGLGRVLGERKGYPLQYSCLETPMDREAWWASSWGCKESDTTE